MVYSTEYTSKWRLIYNELGILTHFQTEGITKSLETIELFDTELEVFDRIIELGYPEYIDNLTPPEE